MSAKCDSSEERLPVATDFNIDATSMMSGISSEKPADERLFEILHIWSAYDVTGDVTIKMGAMCVTIQERSDMILYAEMVSERLRRPVLGTQRLLIEFLLGR